MKKLMVIFGALIYLNISTYSYANPYSVETTITNLGDDTYLFEYEVTYNGHTGLTDPGFLGLDGFYVQVPILPEDSIFDITDPAPYSLSILWAHWSHELTNLNTFGTAAAGYQWLGWWGFEPESVYPVGVPVIFSFKATGVSVISSQDSLITFGCTPYYTGDFYLTDSVTLQGPGAIAAVPTPTAIIPFSAGIAALAAIGRRKKN